MEPAESLDFRFDLRGRIRNLSLPASATNCLIPLFEAVSNSLHAIEGRFGSEGLDKGQIRIDILRNGDDEDSHVSGFKISDNGIGINTENMDSFRTSDSDQKLSRGGKGVGRLTWLKAFSECRVKSTFNDDGKLQTRSFSFSLVDGNPLRDHSLRESEPRESIGTEVTLSPYVTEFEAHCPRKATTIASKIIGHFLPYFMLDVIPNIILVEETGIIDLTKHYSDHRDIYANEEFSIQTEDSSPDSAKKFKIHHVLLKKNLRFLEKGGLHWIFYAGNERVAKESPIESQLGLKYVGSQGDCVYVGLVTGDFLDQHVNQERTGFTYEGEFGEALHKQAVDAAKRYLSEYIERIRALQREITDRVIVNNPQFIVFRKDIPGFVDNNLSLNTQNEEEIFLELSRRKLREKRRVNGQLRSLKALGAAENDTFEEAVQRITKALNDDKKGSLAEYVVRRKEILELLDSSLSYENPEKRKYFKEEVVHDLIVPLRSDSEDLEYDDHNLWILDDRLAFYTYFRSDQPFKTFVEDEGSARRPDLAAFFDTSLAFQREGRDEPIVIVEFKRPGRDDYDGNSNPVVQVLDYVDIFRQGKMPDGKVIADKSGKVLKPITTTTRFICFVVADFTETLLKVVKTSVANNPTADGEGYFGISKEHNATIEVLPYRKMLHDARLRNEAFFAKLGL